MHEIQLRELDLNLLRVFVVIYEERSIARAAGILCLSPSAVSHALGRLRLILDDELFVRHASGMLPTTHARDIGPRLRESLLQLERSLRPMRFDPAASDRHFTVSASPYICTTILPRLIERFHQEAPDCEIEISRRTSTLVNDLDLGEIDLAIGRFGRLPKRIATATLFADRWAWVVNSGNAATDEAALAKLPRVTLLPRDHPPPKPDSDPDTPIDGRATLNVEDTMSAIAVAAGSKLAAVVPARLARALAGFYPLRIHEQTAQPEIRFSIAWHRTHGQDASLVWLRDMFHWAAAAESASAALPAGVP